MGEPDNTDVGSLAGSGRSQERYERVDAQLETPMLIASLAFIPVLAIPALFDVSASTERALSTFGWLLWALFVAEYLVLLWLAPDRRQMVRTHKLDLVIIALPLLRPLRALRIVRLARATAGIGALLTVSRRILARRGLGWALLTTAGIVAIGGIVVARVEADHPDAQITTLADGLWWALVTCTTVGYGDLSPVSGAGRTIAAVLMFTGIGLIGALTANIAAYFVEHDTEDEIAELRADIAALHAKLDLAIATRSGDDTLREADR